MNWEMWEITFRSLRSFLSVPFPKNGRNLQKFPNFKNLHFKSLQNVNTLDKHGTVPCLSSMVHFGFVTEGCVFFCFFEIGKFL